MADLSLSAATPTAKTSIFSGVAGETIAAGQMLYLDANDGRLYKATAAGTKAQADAVGMALNGAVEGNPVDYGRGVIDISGATEGLIYVLSGATAGEVSPHTDTTTPASTEYATVAFVAESATRAHVYPIASGGQVA